LIRIKSAIVNLKNSLLATRKISRYKVSKKVDLIEKFMIQRFNKRLIAICSVAA